MSCKYEGWRGKVAGEDKERQYRIVWLHGMREYLCRRWLVIHWIEGCGQTWKPKLEWTVGRKEVHSLPERRVYRSKWCVLLAILRVYRPNWYVGLNILRVYWAKGYMGLTILRLYWTKGYVRWAILRVYRPKGYVWFAILRVYRSNGSVWLYFLHLVKAYCKEKTYIILWSYHKKRGTGEHRQPRSMECHLCHSVSHMMMLLKKSGKRNYCQKVVFLHDLGIWE